MNGAVVGGAQDVMAEAAVDDLTPPDHPSGEAQHLQAAGQRCHRPPVQRPEDVESGSTPG
jgi:hypothetical protein